MYYERSKALKFLFLICTMMLVRPALIQAQNNAICQDGDCSSELLSIQLPPTNAPAGAPRTEQYKTAYLKVKQLKAFQDQTPGWTAKYNTNQLNGPSCLRLNQLEGYFSHEYVNNPAFAQFIDQNEADVKAWKENGFQASRRAVNLNKRINDKCPQETRKLDKGQVPLLADLPSIYQKLGQEQGYFDERGNLLKPLDNPITNPATAPTTAASGKKPSKKEQINQLKDQVSKLPLGAPMQDKITGIAGALDGAKSKLGGLLGNLLGPLKSRLGTFLPGPLGMASKIKTANDILGLLSKFKPKIPLDGLLSKIGGLFSRGKGLGKKAKDLVDKSGKLKDKYDKLTKKAEDLQQEIDKRTGAVKDLQKQLEELNKKKAELASKLEDKPRKILDELTAAVNDIAGKADDLVKKAEQESKKKDEALQKLDELTKEQEDITKKLEKLEDEATQLDKEQEELTAATEAVQQEVEEAKKKEAELNGLKDQLDQLKPEQDIKDEIAACESELRQLLGDITGLSTVQDHLKRKLSELADKPSNLLERITNLKIWQNKLKLGKKGIPIVGKTLNKVNQLLGKAGAIGSTVELLTGKKSKMQEELEKLDNQVGQIKNTYDNRLSDLDGLKDELVALIAEKSGLTGKIDQAMGDVASVENQVKDFIDRFDLFGSRASECLGKAEIQEKIEDIMKQQQETEPEVEQLEDQLEEVAEQEADLETETQQLEELIEEETTIKEEYGTEMELEPVKAEEWAESFEVERPYWDAVFHPDDEVVEGYKGRYFEIRLKDADKEVKLLFGPGQYFMDKTTFRKTYGSTIGAFATEALQAMKKSDRDKVILFIQGSADLAGHTTFSGNLDDRFPYDEVEVLPQKEDPESFTGTPITKEIPDRNFRNNHLPNLRGRYLKEMISVYSKKFEPIILEGSVKQFQDKEERNAIIYLFFPEELLAEYEE